MKKSLIVLMLSALAIFGGSANAAETVAGATLSATGEATQVSEEEGLETWQIGINATLAGLVEAGADNDNYACTLTANGIAATKPIPDDNPFWTIECANADESSTLLLELQGGNRPIQRSGVSTGWNFLEIGGPITIDGDYHYHVATCRGLLSLPTIELACVVL